MEEFREFIPKSRSSSSIRFRSAAFSFSNRDIQASFASLFMFNVIGRIQIQLESLNLSERLLFLQLIVHLLLGYRELRHSHYSRDDPLVKRVLGLKRLP